MRHRVNVETTHRGSIGTCWPDAGRGEVVRGQAAGCSKLGDEAVLARAFTATAT